MNKLSCLCKKLEVIREGLLDIDTDLALISPDVLIGSSISKKMIITLKWEISRKSLCLSGFEISRLLGAFEWIDESLERIKHKC